MKDRHEITYMVCRPHCRFYRPDEKEELSCQGYNFLRERLPEALAVEVAREQSGMVAPGPRMSEALKELDSSRPPDHLEHDPRIEAVICAQCEFRAEDCDFMGGEDMPDAVPCGGYVLLARLIEAGVEEVEAWLNVPGR